MADRREALAAHPRQRGAGFRQKFREYEPQRFASLRPGHQGLEHGVQLGGLRFQPGKRVR